MSSLSTVFEAYDNCLIEGRFEEGAEELKGLMERYKDDQQIYFWALKRFGDYVGYSVMKDYSQAIDIYQSIINEYENEEDDLYEWCQLDIAKSYLNMAINAFQTFEEMKDIIELNGQERESYFEKLLEKRNSFIESRYEDVVNERI